MSEQALPRGVTGVHVLPAGHHDGPWDNIVVPEGTRGRLLGTALVAMMHGRRLAALPAPPSGLIVLAGPPGTGKTTLARGLAQAAALAVAARGATTFLEIDPHALPSEMLGESQRNVTRLLRDVVPALAAARPHVVVLIDEVESFAVRRGLASFETNPVDVQRATDAVLAGLDHLAATVPGAVVVTTTNFLAAVDEAFLSRADLVVELGLPDAEARARILAAALADLAVAWPELKELAADDPLHEELAVRTAGWDGRRLRKLPLAVLAGSAALARDPARLTAAELRSAVGGRPAERGGSPARGHRQLPGWCYLYVTYMLSSRDVSHDPRWFLSLARRPAPDLALRPGVRQAERARRRLVLCLIAAVAVLDQAAKWWAWRQVPWTKINSGGDILVGTTVGGWYASPVTGALLDLLDFGLLSIAVSALARWRVPAAVRVPGALMIGGWGSNLLDRLGIHYWTAPGSVRGVVDFIHLGSHYYNVADFFIIGCTPLFLLAAACQAVLAARRPAAARSAPAPARSWVRLRARMRDSALAGAGLILVVTLGAANYGGVSAASSEPSASGHACPIAAAAIRPLTGIRVCG